MGDIHEDKKKITLQEEETIWSWNAALPPTPDQTIAQIFSAQVNESADAPAVDAPDGMLTYAQLDNYSTRLAFHLRTILSDISSDEVVPICFDKSIWLVVCMMAVSKAGMAYTTLDPSNPTERLHASLRTISPRIILAEEKYKERFLDIPSNVIADIADICTIPKDRENDKADLPFGLPSDLAYVCFTSGSTGLPKVVQHTQSSAVSNVVQGHGHTANSRILNFASPAFAASVVTTLKTLCNGGLIVLPPERERMGGIANFITKKGITRTVLTPTVMSMLNPEDVQCLQALLVGGEPVSKQLIDIWAPHLTLIEAIGMTEGVSIANVIDTSGKKARARQYMTGCAWIVDPDDVNTLAPIGATGELLFEGPALFQGYRNDPEANAKAFIEELPLWAKNRGEKRPKRLFRTGDLAKYVEDGVVQIVGRKDTRVKLYGQRFELGEVEKAILDCLPFGISVAAEIVHPTSGNGPILVAFIHGLTTDFSQEMKQLRERMGVSLPGYMVPRGFVELKERPLNPSGKLDRKVLRQRAAEMPLIELVKHTGSSDKAAPVTSQEMTMQRLWATVLGLPRDYIGLDDDFFHLGGDSLHCIKLIAEARKENASISIEDILEHRTLQTMSGAARYNVKESNSLDKENRLYRSFSIAPNVPEDQIEDITLATDWQAWCISQGLFKSHGWHDYMIFKFPKALDMARLQKACRELVDNHSILRTIFFVKAKDTFQVILKPEAYPFQFIVKQSESQEIDEFVQTIIQQDIKRYTQLGDPLVIFTLVEDAVNGTQQLIFRISHAQYDAISLNKLWRSLEALYLEKPLAVVPFTKFCQEALQARAESESFWKQTLTGSSMTEVRSHTRPSIDFPVNSAVKRKIPFVDLKGAGFTSATAVLASWSIVLSKLTARDSVVFGYLISGRHLPVPGISDVLGPCMNILPMRADIAPTQQTSSLLNSVQINYMKSLQHGHLGHYRIIERCTRWPRWTRFSTIVNHLSFEFADPPFSGVGECAFSITEPEHDKSDLWLQTLARGNELEIELRYSAKAFSDDWVGAVVDYFVQVYEQLPHMLECKLANNLPLLVATLPQCDSVTQNLSEEQVPEDSVEQRKTLEEMVLSCWESVLGSDFKTQSGFTYSTPFYEVWGNGIAAAALAFEYSRKGFSLSCEEVLGHPSIGETVTYLLSHANTMTKEEN